MQNCSITQIGVKPKEVTEQYKQAKITITYNVDSGRWSWLIEKPRVIMARYHGEAASLGHAKRAAKMQIDKLEINRSKS